ncbi:hypothetical protein BC938DRAFT_478023 [Jimgerdemannia flammicorona]|uniref:Uncharacterized protein n=1 Tax=Jimgerdemannia flammicorona TaxID=994334 RepID=A0A433QNI6_9FUNG|nr:hypothetical protein BC938DRAFT_478023 [Jimgerdemannia flammicorona]
MRGIPVLCSDVGGLLESKCGVTDGIVHVERITGLERELDEEAMRKCGPYKVPPQDPTPWIQQIRLLYTSRLHYDRMATAGCRAARDWIRSIDEGAYERCLVELREEHLRRFGEEATTGEKGFIEKGEGGLTLHKKTPFFVVPVAERPMVVKRWLFLKGWGGTGGAADGESDVTGHSRGLWRMAMHMKLQTFRIHACRNYFC